MRQTFHLAFSGIIAALSVLLMLTTGLIPSATLALPALSGMLLIAVVIESGKRWAWITYGAVALISLLLTPDPAAAWVFLLFFGYYPILKSLIEGLRKPLLEWALKLFSANLALAALAAVAIWVFQAEALITGDLADLLGKAALPISWVILNAVFVLYDIALTKLIVLYLGRIRPKYIDKLRRNFR